VAEQQSGGEQESEDKTEDPTQRRLDQARESGQVPLSRDAVSVFGLLGGAIVLSSALPSLSSALLLKMRYIIENSHTVNPYDVLSELMPDFLYTIIPVGVGVSLAVLMSTFLQSGFLISPKNIAPKFSKINPVAGLKRLMSPAHFLEFLQTLLKMGVVGVSIWWSIDQIERLRNMLALPTSLILAEARDLSFKIIRYAIFSFGVLAGFNFLLTWLKFRSQMRMSRQDLKDEMKESEGDPHIKGRMKQLRMRMARRRIAKAVQSATVVVTNPTHFAVALSYDRGKLSAPRVVAKGADMMAARIRELAVEHNVPIVPNPPLARALFKVPEDQEVPPDLYEAVAKIIAFVMGIKKRT
jgi:flagellar biosynthetic protein FlhB